MSITSPIVLMGVGLFVMAIVALFIISLSEKKKSVTEEGSEESVLSIVEEEKEQVGDFSGLLTDFDFEYEHENPLVELYRRQWIKAVPGAQKDHFLLQYLAFRQLDDEQNAQAVEEDDAPEWTEEQASARLDEILAELAQRTGLQLLNEEQLLFEMEKEVPLSQLDDYTDQEDTAIEEDFTEESSADTEEDDEY